MASSPNRARCSCNQVLRLHRKAWRKPLSEAICVGEKVNLAPKAPHGEARFAACLFASITTGFSPRTSKEEDIFRASPSIDVR
ncbi:hypothetical protein PABG_05810 [Paracoccidioides brasiliensis Pb03]|nr:hypothetical protein PABG_05810 [Paracoccidioides brasiliensis Pb03]